MASEAPAEERLFNLILALVASRNGLTKADILETVGETDRLLILKKPFDAIEIRQMALALTTKWNLTLCADEKRDELQDWLTTLQNEMGVAQTPIKKAS